MSTLKLGHVTNRILHVLSCRQVCRGRVGVRLARILTNLFAALLIVFGSTHLFAQPIRIRVQDDLIFGRIASSIEQTGSVIIAAATGAKTTNGGATDLGGAHSAAKFKVKGDKNFSYSVSLPGSVTLTNSGNQAIIVNNFTSEPPGSGVVSNNGNSTLWVGATLNIGVNQNAGNYSGSYDVTVNYQ